MKKHFQTLTVVFVAAASLTNLYAPPLPDWWSNPSTRILDPANPATIEDNYAPTNLGQLKHVAQQAKEHLDAHLPGGAGSAIDALVASFEPRSGQSYTPAQIAAFRDANYAPINLGQLKAVSKPFYDRLQAFQYDTRANLIARGFPQSWAHSYPWDPNTPPSENYAIANLGQLKAVFSFDLTAPAGQLPEWWQKHFFSGQVGIVPSGDNDGDGVSNVLELSARTNPADSDTDYDGNSDAQELAAGTNPLDAESFIPVRLSKWSFTDTLFTGERGQLPLVNLNNTISSGWHGSALAAMRNAGQTTLRYRDVEADGSANINLRRGTVRFWIKPNWTSGSLGGTGPQDWGKCLELGIWSPDASSGFWALVIDPIGNTIYLASSNDQGGGGDYAHTSLAWEAGRWQQVVLTYSPVACKIYINGQLKVSAPGAGGFPPAAFRAAGFSLGTDINGYQRTDSVIDEFEAFNYELDAVAIAQNFASEDSNSNGIADQWELANFGSIGVDPDADADGDGVTNRQEFSGNSDPNDYYSQPGGGFTPFITIVGGNQQTGPANTFLPTPLQVEVRKGIGGALLANAPVRFAVSGVGGKLAATTAGSPILHQGLEVRASAGGLAEAFYRLPGLTTSQANVTVTAGTGAPVEFLATSQWGNSVPQIAAGGEFSLALAEDGRMWAWGFNNDGQLGDGTTTQRTSPVPISPVSGIGRIIKIAAGDTHSAAISEYGTVWTWGNNGNGRLGTGNTARQLRPTKLVFQGLAPTEFIVDISCSAAHTLALDSSGNMWAWGSGANGRLGNDSTQDKLLPTPVSKPLGMGRIVSVTAGRESSYALDENGRVWAWGSNVNGRLGDGTTTQRMTPVPVDLSTGMPLVVEVASNGFHVLARGSDGSIWSWGANDNGKLGINSTTHQARPQLITTGPTGSIAIAGAWTHSLAVAGNGAVWAWGNNASGQLGNNSTTQSLVPILTSTGTGLTNVVAVSGGLAHSIALKADGSMMGWGRNVYGRLGDGTTVTQRLEPVSVLLLKLTNDDSDSDGLPDSWERFYLGNLNSSGSTNSPGGNLTLLQKYQLSLDPLKPDSDGDGMPDHWEIAQGFDPLDASDALLDADGDRIPNVYEYANNTDPFNGGSYPSPHIVVDATFSVETPMQKKTVSAAVNAAPTISANPSRYTIISVKSGRYVEQITLDNRRILLLGEQGPTPPVLECPAGFTYGLLIYQQGMVLDGFNIRRSGTTGGTGVLINLDNSHDQARLTNCNVAGHVASNGGGCSISKGIVTFTHCTIVDNAASINGRGIYVGTDGRVVLENSIVWNPDGTAPEEIYTTGNGAISVISSIVYGGEYGGMATDPLLDRYSGLTVGSPAIGSGRPRQALGADIHGEPRPILNPDLGADQRVDQDNDGLPDWWELRYFGNLTKASEGDDDLPEGDRLANYYEYVMGLNPSIPDTDGDGVGDLYEAVFSPLDEFYPPNWRLDSDRDGLTDGQELFYRTEPNNWDTNGDGLPDGLSIQFGIDPLSDDPDGDTLTTAQELILGTNPLRWDTDRDEVPDHLDAFPLDPARWNAVAGDPSDTTAPQIFLTTPAEAVEI